MSSSGSSHRNTLFFNHFHTEGSSKHEKRLRDFNAVNHHSSPSEMLYNLQDGQNAVIVLTEHYATNGRDWYKDLGRSIEKEVGSWQLGDHSMVMEEDGSKVGLINGIETSYEEHLNHVVVGGLPIEEQQDYVNLDREELSSLADTGAFIHPAHPYFGEFGIEEEKLDDIIEIGNESDAELFLPETFAYGFFNRVARGEIGSDQAVYDLAEENDADLIVEHDVHTYIPKNLSGVGLLAEESIDQLEKDEIPLENIKDMHVTESEGIQRYWEELFDTKEAVRNYGDFLPGYHQGLWDIVPGYKLPLIGNIDIPRANDEFIDMRDSSYDEQLDFELDELYERSRELN